MPHGKIPPVELLPDWYLTSLFHFCDINAFVCDQFYTVFSPVCLALICRNCLCVRVSFLLFLSSDLSLSCLVFRTRIKLNSFMNRFQN